MATETRDRRAAHRRGITITSVVSIAGIVAGVLSAMFASSPTDQLGLIVLVAVTAVSLGVLRAIGVKIEEFSTKDHLYVWFMSFSLWFITWGILLMGNAGL